MDANSDRNSRLNLWKRRLMLRCQRYLNHILPYATRFKREILRFNEVERVHDLPPIFHYWSNKYLRPKLESFGFSNPEDFFYEYSSQTIQSVASDDRPIRIVSLGAGNAELEVPLAARLVQTGRNNFRLTVTDINERMLDRAREAARESGVLEYVDFEVVDFNSWQPKNEFDVVIANQCLHHVVELEYLFRVIRENLNPDGYFLTSDMIGRKGHARWPEALEIVERFWQQLGPERRWNHQRNWQETEFMNHDCSIGSFEGIRAQDILPLLVRNFHFELFIAFGNVIDVFVDRSFGPNFDRESAEDRAFIDSVQAADEKAMEEGVIKPTHMIAALTTKPVENPKYIGNMTPEFAVRPVARR